MPTTAQRGARRKQTWFGSSVLATHRGVLRRRKNAAASGESGLGECSDVTAQTAHRPERIQYGRARLPPSRMSAKDGESGVAQQELRPPK
jgi:hypothetical protein